MRNYNYICNVIHYNMQERFKQLLEEKGLTATKFAALIKVNASAMSHILNGRSKPGFDVLDKIAQAFPDINLNWLISGKGEIFNTAPEKEKKAKVPVQSSLFEEAETEKQEKAVDRPQPPVQPVLSPEAEVASAIMQTPATKKIKRIILFFSDGSFEDYSKE